jgi:hypothetical protein
MKKLFAWAALAVTLPGAAFAANCQAQVGDKVIDDPTAFVTSLAEAGPTKDKFETQVEFQARVSRSTGELSQKIGATGNGFVVLKIPYADAVDYNADKQVMVIPSIANERYALGSITHPLTGSKGYHGAYLSTTKRPAGTYTTQNGFGASVEVGKIEITRIGLAWDNKLVKMSNNGSLGSPKREVLKPIAGADAKALSDKLYAFVRGKLAFPYATLEIVPGYPTFRNPIDYEQHNYWVFLEPTDVCVVEDGGRIINQWGIERR